MYMYMEDVHYINEQGALTVYVGDSMTVTPVILFNMLLSSCFLLRLLGKFLSI